MEFAKKMSRLCVLVATGVALVACAGRMQPAKQALDAATNAVTAAAPDAGKYEPESYAALEQRLTTVKSAFDSKNYELVLMDAPAVATDAKALAQTAVAKKQEAMKALQDQWKQMSGSLPQQIDAVKAHLAALNKARRRPKGVDLATAKTDMEDAAVLWEKAQGSFATGDLEHAVDGGKDAKAKADAAAAAMNFKITSP